MNILPILYIILFTIIFCIFIKVVVSNTSELSKALLKYLTTNLLLCILFILQVFAVSNLEYEFLLDAIHVILCFNIYTNVIFTYEYNKIKPNKVVKNIYFDLCLVFCALFATNGIHNILYDYEVINTAGMERAVTLSTGVHYLFIIFLMSPFLVHISVVKNKMIKRNSKESNYFMFISCVVTFVYSLYIFRFGLFQKAYNMMYITVVLESIAFYYISEKYELNSDINHVKTHIVENIEKPIVVVRNDGKVVKYNRSALDIFQSLNEFEIDNFFDIKEIVSYVKELKDLHDTTMEIVNKQGIVSYFATSSKEISYNSSNNFYVIVLSDVSSVVAKKDDMDTLVSLDQLTSILNRQAFSSIGKKELEKTVNSNELIAIFMLDLDYFKKVNDTYGHLVGDEILISVSNTMAKVIGDDNCVARYGGEEFCGYIHGDSPTEIEETLQNIRKEIMNINHKIADGTIVNVTASIGYIISNNKDANLDTLYHLSDVALYQAKVLGRNKVVNYDFENN